MIIQRSIALNFASKINKYLRKSYIKDFNFKIGVHFWIFNYLWFIFLLKKVPMKGSQFLLVFTVACFLLSVLQPRTMPHRFTVPSLPAIIFRAMRMIIQAIITMGL